MVWFWWHPRGDAPLWDVPEVREWTDPDWSDDYVRHDWRIRTQWREVAENGVDLTHFHYLHGTATIPQLEFYEIRDHLWHSNSVQDINTPTGPRPANFEIQLHGPGCAWLRFGVDELVEILLL
jgi:hypothetical protein